MSKSQTSWLVWMEKVSSPESSFQEVLEVIQEQLTYDDTLDDRTLMTPSTICHLTELCMWSTYYIFEDHFLNKQKELPWDDHSLQLVLADVYISFFRKWPLTLSTNNPRQLWLRCVDDTIVKWLHGQDTLGDSSLTSTTTERTLNSQWKQSKMVSFGSLMSWSFLLVVFFSSSEIELLYWSVLVGQTALVVNRQVTWRRYA